MMSRIKNTIFLAWWAFRYALITLRHKWYVMHGYFRARVPWWFWRAIWHDMSKFGPSEIFAYGFAFCGPLSKLPEHLKTGKLVIENSAAGTKLFIVFIQNPNDYTDEMAIGTFSTYDAAQSYLEFLEQWRARFMHAWLHHQNRNKHHWEYWIPRSMHFNTDPSMEGGYPIPIPPRYLREMLGDWLGASKAYSGSWDSFEGWLAENLKRIELHDDTLELLKSVLEKAYGPAWVEGVFDDKLQDWEERVGEIMAQFEEAPRNWFDKYFEAPPEIVDFTSENGGKTWTRMTVRVHDPLAVDSLVGEKIVLRNMILNAGSGKVHIFYQIVEPEQRDDSEDDSINPAEESTEEGQEDDGEPTEDTQDAGVEGGADAVASGLPGEGDGQGGDGPSDEDADEEYGDGEDSAVGEGDAADPDVDDGSENRGNDSRPLPPAAPSR